MTLVMHVQSPCTPDLAHPVSSLPPPRRTHGRQLGRPPFTSGLGFADPGAGADGLCASIQRALPARAFAPLWAFWEQSYQTGWGPSPGRRCSSGRDRCAWMLSQDS